MGRLSVSLMLAMGLRVRVPSLDPSFLICILGVTTSGPPSHRGAQMITAAHIRLFSSVLPKESAT